MFRTLPMTLREYCEQFHQVVTGELGGDFTPQVAAEAAAGYELGLSFEQLKRFLACRTEITSVAAALKGPTLSVAAIERILEARRKGAASPKDVLARAVELHIQSSLDLETLAGQIHRIALPGFGRELREGLNLGGGEYVKFSQSSMEVLLLRNDAEHAEVFLPDRASFRFYCYARKGGNQILEKMAQALAGNGISCKLGDGAQPVTQLDARRAM